MCLSLSNWLNQDPGNWPRLTHMIRQQIALYAVQQRIMLRAVIFYAILQGCSKTTCLLLHRYGNAVCWQRRRMRKGMFEAEWATWTFLMSKSYNTNMVMQITFQHQERRWMLELSHFLNVPLCVYTLDVCVCVCVCVCTCMSPSLRIPPICVTMGTACFLYFSLLTPHTTKCSSLFPSILYSKVSVLPWRHMSVSSLPATCFICCPVSPGQSVCLSVCSLCTLGLRFLVYFLFVCFVF